MTTLLDNYKYGFEIEPNLNIHNISNISEYHHDEEDDEYEDDENYNKKSNNILIDKKINQYNKFLTTGIEVKNWNGYKRFVLIKNIEDISEYEDPDNSSILLTRIICYNDELSLDTYESFESVLKKYKDAVASIEE